MSTPTHKSPPRSLVSLRTLVRSLIRTSLHVLLIAVGSLLIFTSHAAAPERDRDFVNALWVAESKALLKIDTSTGQVLLESPATEKPRVIAVDERAGVVWAYGRGVLQQTHFSGARLTRITVPGSTPSSSNDGHEEEDDDGDGHLALTVDAADSAVWLGRNKTLFRFNANGVLQFNIALPHPVRAQSLEPARRVLWVATKKNLLAYDTRGIKVGEIRSGQETEIQDLVIDASLDSLWVATEKHLRRYSTSGTLQFERGFRKINRIASDGRGGLWVATDKELSFLDVSGLVRFTVTPFQGHSEGKIIDVAADPADRSVWVMTKKALSHIDPEGQILHALNFKEKGEREYRLHALAIYSDVLPPTLSVTAPLAGSYVNTLRPSLRLSYSDTGIGVDTSTLTTTANQRALTLTCEFEIDTATCLPSSPFPEGLVSLHLTVKDFAGNISDAAEIRFTVDTIPPTITVTEPAEGFITRHAVQLIKGQVSEPAELRVNSTAVPLQSDNTFSHTVPLSEGVNVIPLVAIDRATNQTTQVITLYRDTIPPALPLSNLISIQEAGNGEVTVTGRRGAVEASARITIRNTRTGVTVTVIANNDGSFSVALHGQAGDTFSMLVSDRAGNDSGVIEITLPVSGETLPPDPAQVAPPTDLTKPTTLFSATEFLYTGTNPIQRNVTVGAIASYRATLLRGRVLTRNETPLSGVRITVMGHPELGYTLSRLDGRFDLVINGGGAVTLNYVKEGYLRVQRTPKTNWQEFIHVEDVVLTPLDPNVTSIDLLGSTMQVAQSSSVTDESGTRKVTLFFEPGTTATLTRPDGGQEILSHMDVRATEYTVGANGPLAMPSALPPSSGYTYAVELSVDTALSQGAKRVDFDQPVAVYVNNFIGFPVGHLVPSGWYDSDTAVWKGSKNGLVLKIIGIDETGAAVLDLTGSGQPATPQLLNDFGIDGEERQKLAALFQSGQSFWRVEVTHFTPWDFNWPYSPPTDAITPQNAFPDFEALVTDEEKECGSIIGCENRTFGESIPITGTPYSLNYFSNRMSSRQEVNIPVIGNVTVPASLREISLEIVGAGQHITKKFPPMANQSYTFKWDGNDAYGRRIIGSTKFKVRIFYAYDMVYVSSNYTRQQAWAEYLKNPIFTYMPVETRTAFTDQKWSFTLENGPADTGITGWSFSNLHAFAPGSSLVRGDGQEVKVDALGQFRQGIVSTIAGGGSRISEDGINGLAADIRLLNLAVDVSGAVVFYDPNSYTIRRLRRDGVLESIVGTPGSSTSGYGGDGGPAVTAKLRFAGDIAIGQDGSLYFTDTENYRIRKVTPDGLINTIAGTGRSGFSGDGGQATQAAIADSMGIAVDDAGTVFFADCGNNRIRKIAPDGTISTVIGGLIGIGGEGTLAAVTPTIIKGFACPWGIAVDADGNLYFPERSLHRIRKVSPAGIIRTIAGTGRPGIFGDGGLATQARLNSPRFVDIDKGGRMFISGDNVVGNRIRTVDSDGIIRNPGIVAQHSTNIIRVRPGPDGRLYATAWTGGVIKYFLLRIEKPIPDYTGDQTTIVSKDAPELFVFDAHSRHIKTMSTLTGGTLGTFDYDAKGFVTTLVDGDNNRTVIERNEAKPTAIVSPDGQRTILGLGSEGNLTSITNPAGETLRFEYDARGLMTKMIDPKLNETRIVYDEHGRLVRETNAADGFWAFNQQGISPNKTVFKTSALGRSTSYALERLSTGDPQWVRTAADGTVIRRTENTDGSKVEVFPNGTVVHTERHPDARFSMQTPIHDVSMYTPGGRLFTSRTNQTINIGVLDDPLDYKTLTYVTTIKDRDYVETIDRQSSMSTTTTPEGRSTTRLFDSQYRVTKRSVPGITDVFIHYDSRGRLSQIVSGTDETQRLYTLSYDDHGNLSAMINPLGQPSLLNYDLAGRVTQRTLPDSHVIQFSYDENGNMTSLTPPGKTPHLFHYTVINQENTYQPPPLGTTNGATHYMYNLDKQLTSVIRPDGLRIDLDYDTGGRLTRRVQPNGLYQFGYDPTSGQLSTVTAPGGQTLSYAYDGFLPTAETWSGPITGTVSRQYDDNLWVTDLSVNGQAIHFSYDRDGLAINAGSLTLGRNGLNGLLTGTALGFVTTSTNYSTFGEMSQDTARLSGIVQYDVTYVRDKLGRITEKLENVQGQTKRYGYTYDLAGRLHQVHHDGVLVSQYNYDPNGNRIGGFSPGGNITATYDAQDRLTNNNNAMFTYTPHGELKTKTENSATTHYDYDVIGNLRQVRLPNGTVVDYVIDGQDRRIGKKTNGTLVQGFLYQDQLEPIAELDATSNVVARFIYASKAHSPDYMIKNGETFRFITDHLGSVRLVINTSTGQLAQRIDYDEFGNVLTDTNPGFQPFGFAGGLYDQHTRFVRFGARDYDARIGRWTVKDPIGFQSGETNFFSYSLNDPINYQDINGEAVGGILAVGAGILVAGKLAYDGLQAARSLDKLTEAAEKNANLESARMGELEKAAKGLPNTYNETNTTLSQSRKDVLQSAADTGKKFTTLWSDVRFGFKPQSCP